MAALYRKKVIVEAKRFWPSKKPWPEGVSRGIRPLFYLDSWGHSYQLYRGDWILTNDKGERYPCSNDIFKRDYELARKNRKVGRH